MEGGAADIGKVIVGNGPLFDFGMGASSINTKLRPIALTYMVTKLAAHSLTKVQQSPTENFQMFLGIMPLPSGPDLFVGIHTRSSMFLVF